MTEIDHHSERAADLRRSRRALIICIALAVSGFSMFGGISWYRKVLQQKVHGRLEEIRLAGYPVFAHQLNPGRGNIPSGENAAMKILEAFDALSTEPPKLVDLTWAERRSSFPLESGIKSTFQQVSSNNIPASELLGRIRDMSQSDFLIDWSPGPATLLPHLNKVKTLAILARIHHALALDATNSGAAVDSILETLALGHSIADEPCVVSQLVRIHCVNLAVTELELLLNMCSLTHEQIEGLRKRFEQAQGENRPGFTRALLGERCMGIGIFQLPIRAALRVDSDLPDSLAITYPLVEFTGIHERDFLFYLDVLDRWVAASEMPFPNLLKAVDAAAAHDEQELSKRRFAVFSKLLLPGLRNPVDKMANLEGRLRRAQLGLAIEDYRIAHGGQLPETIMQMVPEYLSNLPADPLNGQILRFERSAKKGYVIVGPSPSSNTKTNAVPALSRDKGQKLPEVTFRIER